MPIWCPYLGGDIDETEATDDHIIPLSFNGCNQLQIPASRLQCKIGTEVEGKLANEFFLAQHRIGADARGRSKKPPRYAIKKAHAIGGDMPLRASFSPGEMVVYDPRTREPLQRPTDIQFKVEIHKDEFITLRARMLAKVALGIGYWEFGDAFRAHAHHEQLRRVMMCGSLEEFRDDREFPVRLDVPVFGTGADDPMLVAVSGLCKAVGKRSCVGILPTEGRLGVFVGLLGSYLGYISCECDIDALWVEPDNYYGKFFLIRDKRVVRMGLREALERVLYSKDHDDAWDTSTPPGLRSFIDGIRRPGWVDR